jgi:hypothetical protein
LAKELEIADAIDMFKYLSLLLIQQLSAVKYSNILEIIANAIHTPMQDIAPERKIQSISLNTETEVIV